MKKFFGARVVDEESTRVEYYILSTKNSYGIQVSSKDESISSSSIMNITDSRDYIMSVAAKLFRDAVMPGNLYDMLENVLLS